MKNNFKLSNVYAKSLYDYANDLKKSNLVYHDMKKVEKILRKFPKIIYYVLNNPLIKMNIKLNIIYSYFNFSCNLSKRFYKMVFFKKRGNILLDISIEYQKIYEYAKGIVKLQIISTIPLNNFLYEKILIIVNKINSNVKYEILNTIDKNLIGGICLYIEDKKWDFSIKNTLIKIKKNFSLNRKN